MLLKILSYFLLIHFRLHSNAIKFSWLKNNLISPDRKSTQKHIRKNKTKMKRKNTNMNTICSYAGNKMANCFCFFFLSGMIYSANNRRNRRSSSPS